MMHLPIAFIGAGNMSKAIITGMVEHGYPPNLITASNPSLPKLENLQQKLGINITQDNLQAIEQSEAIVLAVKPQLMEEVCAQFPRDESPRDESMHSKLFISIAAGINSDRLYAMLGGKYPLVRTMPNTPSAVGKGLTGLFSENASNEQRTYTETLFNMVGKTVWAEQEAQINGVIAAAGSAPAYFFLFLEAMQHKAQEFGFSAEDARLMVQQAMTGAAEMVCKHPELELSELRTQVMSKGGTTAKAIEYFQANGIENTISGAMQAAVDRAEEMAKLF